MRLRHPPRKPQPERIVPMINVVFLLLVFFLMTATLAPPDPFEIAPPAAEGPAEAERTAALYLAADGGLAYGAYRGEAVFPALAARDAAAPLVLVADRAVPSGKAARLLARLAAAGVPGVALVVEPL